jgi:HEAT repeat protein
VLQSNASPHDKDAACARLKRIGTARAIPALAALLPDPDLSHSARYALESMPFPKAGSALVEALDKTQGETLLGIINSVGLRREAAAVPSLSRVLIEYGVQRAASAAQAANEAAIAAAAATALGQIGDKNALRALEGALERSSATGVHAAIVDGLLRYANRLVDQDRSQAVSVFRNLFNGKHEDYVRLAAYRGMIRSSGSDSIRLITGALTGESGPSQIAALEELRQIDVPGLTEACVGVLPRLQPLQQVALVDALAQRGDPIAAQAIVGLTTNSAAAVRLAAYDALAGLGDSSVGEPLAEAAASHTGVEQVAARQALVLLRRGNPTAQLIELLPSAQPSVQTELARALGERRDGAAVPKLAEMAQTGSESARRAALQALAATVSDTQVGLLVGLVEKLNEPGARTDAATALNTACQRLQTADGKIDVGPLVQALSSSAAPVRVALLPVCSGLPQAPIRQVFQTAIQDSDPTVRTAAIRALCDTTDPELLGELLKVASSAPEENLRTPAIAASVRLTRDEAGRLSSAQRLAALKALLQSPLSVEQKRLVLSGLAEVPDPEAMTLAQSMLEEPGVETEAARAVIKVAGTVPSAQSGAAREALERALKAPIDPATRADIEAMLKQIEAGAEYITTWQVAGPYRQAGKDYSALFDMPFPPENAQGQPQWRELAAGADPKRPWVMDLLKALGGEQCVAYARTWVRSDQAQPAVLELGSDDGVKVWLNNELVYSLNVARPLTPGSDKVKLSLKQGWNPLLLKVTQNNLGWEFCTRLVKPDGTHLTGLDFKGAPSN